MPTNSHYIRLAECAQVIRGVSYKPNDVGSSSASVELLRATNIGTNQLTLSDTVRVPPALVKKAQLLQKYDVVITMSSGSRLAVGRLAQLRHEWYGTFGAFCGAIRPNPELIDPAFLGYLLNSRQFRAHIDANAEGTAIMNLTGEKLLSYEFNRPDITQQKRIAAILGSLDDKIELNRKMNETLEQMAKALFKSWFVDFEPVHAKAAGRQPAGMDKATANLFPDSFTDSELGMIPNGWDAGSLSNLSEFSRASINPGESPSEIFDHYSLPSFDEGKVPKAEAGSEIKSNKLVVTKDCVLLSKLNPHIPRIWLPNLNVSRRSICSTEFIVAAATTGCTREYLYALFISEDFSRTYGTLVTGTTGSHQRIRPESVLQMKLPIAPAEIISSFTNTVAPILNQVACNTKESQTLAEVRDTLLPQLLAGELKAS